MNKKSFSLIFFIYLALVWGHVNSQSMPGKSEQWHISFVSKVWHDPDQDMLPFGYWAKLMGGVQRSADNLGAEIDVIMETRPTPSDVPYGEKHIQLQIQSVKALIEKGETDGIIIAPVDSQRLVPIVEKAVEAGIPVVAVDTAVNSDKILTYVVHDDFSGGKVMGEWIAEQLEEENRVLILTGPQDEQNVIDRLNGFLTGLKIKNLNILDIQSANWEENIAESLVESWLRQYNEIDAVVALSDSMGVGAARAIENQGREGIMVTGYGAYINDTGLLAASLDNFPANQGVLAIEVMVEHLKNNKAFSSREMVTQSLVRIATK